MIARLTGTENGDGDGEGDGDSNNDESALQQWLATQNIPSHSETCVAKFRMNVVEDSSSKRLFHGHDCGTEAELNYTLKSHIYLRAGTLGSSAISAYSQDPDAACAPVDDDTA